MVVTEFGKMLSKKFRQQSDTRSNQKILSAEKTSSINVGVSGVGKCKD